MEAIYLVISLMSPPGAPIVPQEAIAQMSSAALCRQEAARIEALPYVTEVNGYKLGASCHDQDYIKRQN
jgi:hypothetical protein